MKRGAAILAIAAFVFCAPRQAWAQPSPAPESTATPASSAPAGDQAQFDLSKLTPEQQQALQLAIIKTSQNPVGNITVFPFQNNFNYGYGRYTRLQYNLNVQPVIPIMLGQNMNLIARTIIPVINQPSPDSPVVCASPGGCPSTFGMSDTQEQLFFAPKTKPGELIWGAGPIFQVPSATPGVLGTGKWSAGPDAVVLMMPGKWVLGTLVTQLWSFAGQANRSPVNSLLVQPFVNYNMAGGWAVSSAPIITSNFTLTQNKWAVPLGGGVARTFKDGDQLMSLSVQYYTYITRPLASPQTNLKVTWSLLWPVKRGINIQDLLQEAK
ncbi:MAG TPA: hypothetical protein VFF63_00160 [Candidatus Babeliales bacterium]|nr:hypothetical protein [Candidatus Babeliales bacterium]